MPFVAVVNVWSMVSVWRTWRVRPWKNPTVPDKDDNDHGSGGDVAEPDAQTIDPVPLPEVMHEIDELDPADPDWTDLQWYVADQLHDRYLEGGVPDDLEEAIRRGRLVVAAQGEQSPAHLHDLALMLWDRIDATHPNEKQRDEDLGEYVRLLAAALTLLDRGEGDPELRAKCQANLATGLVSRSRYEAPEQDHGRATALWEEALESATLDDDTQAGIAANLAQALSRDGAGEDDLRRAVAYGRRAVEHRPVDPATDDPEEMAHNEFALASALASLHNIVDDNGLLDEAVEWVRRGLDHLGPSHPDAPGYTANLIGLLRQLARETGDAGSLYEAVRLARNTVRSTTDADVDRVLILTTAAAAISEAAAQGDDATLLNEALGLYRHAIAIAPDSSVEQGVALINLTATCRDGNERLDAPDLITEGIDAGDRALGIFAEPGPHRAAALTATSNCLRDHFVLTGEVAVFDRALGYAEEALVLTPETHPERAARLTNLAVLLSDDFTERADRGQLDRAIALYREALRASERVGVRVPERLNDLALALRDRHKDTGNIDDLNEAVDLAENALTSSRPGVLTWAGYASNLGNALAERYELDGDPDDLNRAIELFGQALADAADRVYESSGYAANLGLALATRALSTGAMADMDQALLSLGRSIDLLPPAHPDRAYRISNLADVYRQRSIMFDHGGHAHLAQDDAATAVATAEDAVAAAGGSDARLLPALSNLAEALRWQRELMPDGVSGSRIIDVQRRAATLSQITPAEKFGQAGRWARDAELDDAQSEALDAYALAVSQTTEVAWIGLSVVERLGLLREMTEVLSRGVACAARAGEPWTAVAWADHVRSVLWRQGLYANALGTRRDDPRLRALSGLQHEPATETEIPDRLRREQHRQWAHAEREALHVPITGAGEYQVLTFPGVIVLLVPGQDTSCALLMRAQQDPHLVELPGATREDLIDHIEKLRMASAVFGASDDADPLSEQRARHATFDCLDWLWDAVAAPILDQVTANAAASDPNRAERPRLWWSPLGEFALLPIHAAGHHPRKTGQLASHKAATACTVPDRARSSYLPTILAPRSGTPRDARARPSRAPGSLLYVSANDPSGSLAHLDKEHEAVRSAIQHIPITELIDQRATCPALHEAIPRCSYLHIAGHGSARADDSLQVGFRLSDGMFTLRHLAGCDTESGTLAVLLTCDSAAGDTQTPNEALHVAGAAHQAGFPDVIAATMPVRDASTVPVVRAIYQALEAAPDAAPDNVPAALDTAAQTLRLDPATATDPLSWVPYAHFLAGFDS